MPPAHPELGRCSPHDEALRGCLRVSPECCAGDNCQWWWWGVFTAGCHVLIIKPLGLMQPLGVNEQG